MCRFYAHLDAEVSVHFDLNLYSPKTVRLVLHLLW